MDCKYCIVPQKANKFWQLVEGMALTHEQQGLLQSAFIRHVEVSPARLTWEILLETRAFIDEPLLRSISRHIAERYGQRDVIFYQKVVDLAAVLKKIPRCRQIGTTGGKATEILFGILGLKFKDFHLGETTKTEYNGRELSITRLPSTSRAYPMKLAKKAEYYRAFFTAAGVL